MKERTVPALRLSVINDIAPKSAGDYVLYWMTSARRLQWNFSLQRAVEWAVILKKPLIILEALRCDYQWASDRLHAFIIQGMQVNAAACAEYGVTYLPYIEPQVGAGRGLLSALAKDACVVVGDDYPAFFLRRMITAAATQVPCRFETVDGNGLLPLRASEKASPTAYVFRRWLQKQLPIHLDDFPQPFPLKKLPRLAQPRLPSAWGKRWKAASDLSGTATSLSTLPIDHSVLLAALPGGMTAAQAQMKTFLRQRLARYHEDRNVVDNPAASGLSPWLHMGHISAHEVCAQVFKLEEWGPEKLAAKATGIREGWWGLSPAAEAFFDELITWREVGYHYCHHRPTHDTYDDLPTWAQQSLEIHADDPRAYIYSLAQFTNAQTHDPLWNAAQRELVQTGMMHNYLRMLWGKKIIEWTRHPRDAFAIMTELNNRFALDGRDPNSSSGISWCFGRFDRPWMTRPIFGTIRYMTSASTMNKIKLKNYLQRYGDNAAKMGVQGQLDFAP